MALAIPATDCLWSKPGELTDYSGNGYEIAAMTSRQMSPDSAPEQWRAIGGAVSEHYAVVWFGEEEDAGATGLGAEIAGLPCRSQIYF